MGEEVGSRRGSRGEEVGSRGVGRGSRERKEQEKILTSVSD